MSKTTTNLLLMLITIIAGTYFYINYCSECGATAVEEPPMETAVPKEVAPTSYPFAFSDGNFSYEINDNYNFNVSSPTILMPLASGIGTGISQLQNYFSGNPDKVINVIGFYTSDEENYTAYPDLGLARANAVKNHLVAQGIPSVHINVLSELKNEMVAKEGIYYGPIAYAIDMKSETADEDLSALFDKINADPLILYFNTAEASISLDADQRQKVADISRYIDKVADATVSITGHTDNTGLAATNMKLGLDRANFAKDYLMRNGITSEKIRTSSKGQTEPIADNSTEEGKAKNRRTVVTLNK
jgi:outer membrane protein OmpA-like peptidoglycan-associated protein